MCTVHTKPKEFENNGFTLKTYQMFSVRTMEVILDLYLRKTQAGEYHDNRDVIVFEKFYF